ncbi:non-heme iron oxygenase ferredoxin subunit [Brevibacillus dissolubilis]|uniref:non-heme iron oxygenase ferredoxin subunit n=1 Tax=Brevibacillus dissolubilis TaxID=1844116 RepID=UPI0011172A39|nr:non-heme iron oxygenase ferredoxin subunit [Brevibacillus dissolubilis]
MPWKRIAGTDEIGVGEMKQVIVDGAELALYHLDDGFYVTSDICTHRKQYLTDGSLAGHIVACPRHGGTFDVKTGAPASSPCVIPLQTYPVEIRQEEVWIEL